MKSKPIGVLVFLLPNRKTIKRKWTALMVNVSSIPFNSTVTVFYSTLGLHEKVKQLEAEKNQFDFGGKFYLSFLYCCTLRVSFFSKNSFTFSLFFFLVYLSFYFSIGLFQKESIPYFCVYKILYRWSTLECSSTSEQFPWTPTNLRISSKLSSTTKRCRVNRNGGRW